MKNSVTATEHMDMNRSASPTTTWNSRKTSNTREIDLAHGRPEGTLQTTIAIFRSFLMTFSLILLIQ